MTRRRKPPPPRLPIESISPMLNTTSNLSVSSKNKVKLSDTDVIDLANLMKTAYGWTNSPHSFQLAGVKAQLEKTNMIIQAPTGAGKTAIAAGPHLWPSSKGKMTIMVSPHMALEDEMVREIMITISERKLICIF